MAMQAERQGEVITEINVTPLVDVCLVLVIIFMAVAPFAIQAGLQVLQSQSRVHIGKAAASENVQIRLTRAGAVTVNGRVSALDRLWGDVRSALASSRDRIVILTADKDNRVGEVVTVMDVAKQAGAAKVSIMKTD